MTRFQVSQSRFDLRYSPAPVDNPLKGLVPYRGAAKSGFGHSMEFDYLPLSDLVVGYDQYNWKPLDAMLSDISGRGNQAIFRIFLEYPGRKEGIPSFLVKDGLNVTEWKNTNTQPFPPTEEYTPDYNDARLRRVLREFIMALGKRYDGDARIAFITAGLLGSWGEWHTFPRNDLFATQTVQTEVMDAYENAFRKTPILLRYPSNGSDGKAANHKRALGYHDDSFAWATLDTGKESDDWFYMPALQKAGMDAVSKWKTKPIGGEIRPEAWGEVFDAQPKQREIQNFRRCVEATHATWLMDSGMFKPGQSAERIARAETEVRHMGYEFHVPSVVIAPASGNRLSVQVTLQNRGVAPLYHDWPAEFALLRRGRIEKTAPASGKLTGLLPGDKPRIWRDTLSISGIQPGSYKLALRVPNPLPKGKPIRFANQTQDADVPGWLTLGQFTYR